MLPPHDAGDFEQRMPVAPLPTEPLDVPIGVAWSPPRHLFAPVHVIDGDGASLCEQVAAQDLVPISNRSWHDIERGRRCQICRFLVATPSG